VNEVKRIEAELNQKKLKRKKLIQTQPSQVQQSDPVVQQPFKAYPTSVHIILGVIK